MSYTNNTNGIKKLFRIYSFSNSTRDFSAKIRLFLIFINMFISFLSYNYYQNKLNELEIMIKSSND